MQKSYDYVLKFVIVGSSSVGKSSILRRFADDEFEESYISTIGIDFRFKYPPPYAGPCTSRRTTLSCRSGTLLVSSASAG
jgi:GTPase SAR1 family protein